jgi:nucleoside-triphosphatase
LEKRVIILTGSPGGGKTTTLEKTVNALKKRGVSVGGMISREVREDDDRVGFEILDIATGKKGWLAHLNQKSGPQVGKYRVNLGDLESVGVQAINDSVEKADVVAIDEIGPMELFSEKFKVATRNALESNKLVITVVHWKAQDQLVVDAKSRADAAIFVVTTGNRETLPEKLTEQALAFLDRAKSTQS